MLTDWQGLDSSWADAVRVDRENDYLDIRFKDGTICRYRGASAHFDSLVSASSAGSYINSYIKYLPYTQL